MERYDADGKTLYSKPLAASLEEAIRNDVDAGFLQKDNTLAYDETSQTEPVDLPRRTRASSRSRSRRSRSRSTDRASRRK